MCLWVLTACLGLIQVNPSNVVVVTGGVPPPILVPTAAPTTTTTTARPTTTTTTARPTGPPVVTTTLPAMTSAPPTPPVMTTARPVVTTPAMTSTTPPMSTAPPAMTTARPPMTTVPATSSPTVALTTSALSGVYLPILLCSNPDIVCTINPNDYQTTTGPPIDPRLGITPAASGALQQRPPIVGYSVQMPSYDTAVRFPRERRSVRVAEEKPKNIRQFLTSLQDVSNKTAPSHVIRKRQANCFCVAAGTCPTANANNGAGMIDTRIVSPGASQCPAGQVYCCGVMVVPTATPTPPAPVACGRLQTVPATTVTPNANQAKFGEFPWQALLLTMQNDYIAGAVLIDQRHVLTVTHRLTSYVVSGTAPNLKVRLGEWDAAGTYEPIAFQEYTIQRVFSHPSYNSLTLQYDITVMRLSSSVPLTPMAGAAPSINRACLPPSSTTSYVGQRCWVSGWGKNMFGLQGQYQQILKKVDVSIVAPASCQTSLQTARLGTSYVLDTTSFLCAGGEANKDSCTGDGGSGLVCEANGQWTLVGLVSWGLGCASANVPGVYMNVAALLPWIQQQIATP